jgi:hypothetical protein
VCQDVADWAFSVSGIVGYDLVLVLCACCEFININNFTLATICTL